MDGHINKIDNFAKPKVFFRNVPTLMKVFFKTFQGFVSIERDAMV